MSARRQKAAFTGDEAGVGTVIQSTPSKTDTFGTGTVRFREMSVLERVK